MRFYEVLDRVGWLVDAAFLFFVCQFGKRSERLAKRLTEIAKQEGLEGLAWSLVQPDGSVEVGAIDVRDAETGANMHANDRVHVGSVTKTLIAAGVLQLVTEKKLTLDTPVADLLPQLAIRNRWASKQPLLVRHLLNHTSGLDDARLRHIFSAQASPDNSLADAFVEEESLLELRFPLASAFPIRTLVIRCLAWSLRRLPIPATRPILMKRCCVQSECRTAHSLISQRDGSARGFRALRTRLAVAATSGPSATCHAVHYDSSGHGEVCPLPVERWPGEWTAIDTAQPCAPYGAGLHQLTRRKPALQAVMLSGSTAATALAQRRAAIVAT